MAYNGPWRAGRFHGTFGECIYPNGDQYEGPWVRTYYVIYYYVVRQGCDPPPRPAPTC